MSGPDVGLDRLPVATVRDLVGGTLARPDAWHPQFPGTGSFAMCRMLLATYDALGRVPDDRTPWWVYGVAVDAGVVGHVGVHGPPADEGPAEVVVGYEVVPALRRRGVATRAFALLLDLAWTYGADRVRAQADADNPASRAVLAANGFVLVPGGADAGEFVATPPRRRT